MNGVAWMAARIIAATTQEQRDEMRNVPRPTYDPAPLGQARPDDAEAAAMRFREEFSNSRPARRFMSADTNTDCGFNPRPLGKIRPESTTEAVLRLLRENPGRHFGRWAIVERTGRSDKAVDWALLYLRSQGLVVAHEIAEPTVNSRYLRYSALIVVGQGA